LNNVVFGIALMLLVAAYIAVGSGLAGVREYFEMNELEFFNAWPLKVLMLLLCLNLATVTLSRIPLTPPRYGVWCIHSGIVTLIVGTSLYYHLKVEGKTLIPVSHEVNLFYDSGERALYARVLKGELYGMRPLPGLPRFGNYGDEKNGGHDPERLRRDGLMGIDRFTPVGLPESSLGDSSGLLASWLGVAQPVTLDIVGFYSYADVQENVVDDPSSNETGVEVDVPAQGRKAGSRIMLRATDPTAAHQFVGGTELEYRQVSDGSLGDVRDSVNRLFEVSPTISGTAMGKMDLGIGNAAVVGPYSVSVESYNPAFPMFGTHEIVEALTLHVVHGKAEFWRMILGGRDLQTDFKMDPATTPPMVKGNRQKEPIDRELVLTFRVNDPAALLPTSGDEKHVLLTAGEKRLVDIHVSMSAPTVVSDLTGGGEILLPGDSEAVAATVRRADHFRIESEVVPTPKEKQTKDLGESGTKQVAVVRVKCGNWSQDVPVPCDLYAAPDPMVLEPMIPWSMGVVQVPGASAALQLQLGYTCRPLPVAMMLKKFDMVPYAGGLAGENSNTMFRDFRSTLELTDPDGHVETDETSLNSPIYYDRGNWIFFQAGYDPDGQSSTIGVGNRPGVVVMLTGCIMIVLGLLYAFYVKPIVIARMKAAAIAEAGRKKKAMADNKVGAV
jgi:hypothetical protein